MKIRNINTIMKTKIMNIVTLVKFAIGLDFELSNKH